MPKFTISQLAPRSKVFTDANIAGFGWLQQIELIIQFSLPIIEMLLPQAIVCLSSGVRFSVVYRWVIEAATAMENNVTIPEAPTCD